MRRMRRHFEVACVILDNLKGESIEKRRKKETVGWSPVLSDAHFCDHLESLSESLLFTSITNF